MDTLFGPRVPELSGSVNGGKLVGEKAPRGAAVRQHARLGEESTEKKSNLPLLSVFFLHFSM